MSRDKDYAEYCLKAGIENRNCSTDTTHYEGCWDSGQKHYECAMLEVKRLRGVESLLREIKQMNKDDMLENILSRVKSIDMRLKKKKWVDLTQDEASEIWERIDDRDIWKLIMQVQQSLKEKNQ